MRLLSILTMSLAFLTLSAIPAPQAAEPDRQTRPDVSEAAALNHIYVVLDAATFAAVRDSRELATVLGRTDGGLPDYAPPGPDADRVFFRGRETYLEFFAPDNRFDEPVGKVGLALGHDVPAAFDALDAAWRATCQDRARRTEVAFQRIQPPVPWYDAIQCDDTAVGPQLAVWAMVYRPEFQRWQSGAGADAVSRTARADILAPRRSDGQGRFDVTEIALDVDVDLLPKLVQQMESAGFARHEEEGAVRLKGQGWDLVLHGRTDAPRRLSLQITTETPASASFGLAGTTVQPTRTGAQLRFELTQAE